MNNDKQLLIQIDSREDVSTGYDSHVIGSGSQDGTEVPSTIQLPPNCEIVPQNYITVPLQKPRSLPQYVATIAATLSAFAAGTVLAWTSPIITTLEKGQYNNISINEDEMGWIGSFVTLGAMVTCFPFGIICDVVGRKIALLILIVPFSVGWCLIVWANSLVMLYFGRFITGMAAGACCVAAPLYTNEIADKNIRGTLGSYFQLMVTMGILFAYILGKFVPVNVYTIVCAIVPFCFFIFFVFQPESPYYSLKKGQPDVAFKNLQRLRGPNYNTVSELDSIKSHLEESMQSSVSLSYAMRKKSGYKAFIIALALMFFQQLSGINAIIFYTSDIFKASGAKIDPQIATICVGTFQVVATFISSLIVDKLGRRMLLISSDFIMAFATIFLGLFFTFKDRHIVSDGIVNMLGFLPIVALCIFIIMFSMGLGPIPWTITGEIFSPDLKSFAVSCAATLNWFLAFLVTKFFLKLEVLIGSDVMFYIFSVICLIGTVFCYMVVPETKGKTIEQVQDELER
ncbi:hypothetical protein RN001_009574 [Aquatica leii]|uniref:Major facilitator superfamily (MFS) profile domain-containing protein n=1 Tax=Aquatica leii TaxID=1421715 RepID=A0AAN7QGJ0_9COLE|nr:hypothetical protein RN001_009574 [Aquatica leii]